MWMPGVVNLQFQDGGVEGHVLTFCCKNTKIASNYWTTIDKRMLEPTKKIYPITKGKGEAPNKMKRRTQSHLKSNLIPTRDAWRAQTKPYAQQDRGKGAVTPTRDWTRPAFECLRVFSRGMSQQWPATGTEVLAKAVLEGTVCGISPFGEGRHSLCYRAACQATHKLENSHTKKVLPLLQKF